MMRHTPRCKRNNTLFPYTTPFRSTEMLATQAGATPLSVRGLSRPGVRGSSFAGRHGSPPANCSANRSEEHTSELKSLMRISYAVFCLKKKPIYNQHTTALKKH